MKNLQELEYIACASNPGKQSLKICFWFDFCFMALQHILGHIVPEKLLCSNCWEK